MLQASVRRGEFDRQVTFLRPIITTGTANSDQTTGWGVVASNPTVKAKKVDLRGNDIVESDRLTYTQRTKWIIDYRSDISSINRLYEVGRAKVYAILSVTDFESSRNRYLEVMTNLLDNEVWT